MDLETLAEGLKLLLTLGLTDGDTEAEGLSDLETLGDTLGETEALPKRFNSISATICAGTVEGLIEGDIEGLTDLLAEGETLLLAEGLTLLDGLKLGLTEALGDTELLTLGETLGETEGEIEAEALTVVNVNVSFKVTIGLFAVVVPSVLKFVAESLP